MSNPSSVQYSVNELQEAQNATSELRIFRSENSSYEPLVSNSQIIIPINCSSGSFIDFSETTISWKITNRSFAGTGIAATNASVYLDGGMLGAIDSLEIRGPQSQTLEYIRGYGELNDILYTYQTGPGHAVSIESVLNGMSKNGRASGQVQLAESAAGATAAADGGSVTLVDNLVSGMIGSKMLCPAGFLTGSPLKLILNLKNPDNYLLRVGSVAIPAGKCGYRIENVEIRAKEVRFNELFNTTFLSTLQAKGDAGMSFYGETFIHSSNNIGANSNGEQDLQFSASCQSAKGIMTCIRPSNDISDNDEASITARYSAGMESYRYEINGQSRPNQRIQISSTNKAQAYSQVLETFGVIGNLDRETMIDESVASTSYYKSDKTVASKFLVALPLEDFNDGNVLSGENLSLVSAPIRFMPTLATGGTLAAQRVDHWVWCDVKFTFDISGRMDSEY